MSKDTQPSAGALRFTEPQIRELHLAGLYMLELDPRGDGIKDPRARAVLERALQKLDGVPPAEPETGHAAMAAALRRTVDVLERVTNLYANGVADNTVKESLHIQSEARAALKAAGEGE